MPSVREFLERLRPSGTPGAPSAAGVPVDRVAEVAAELQDVFDALDTVQVDGAEARSARAGGMLTVDFTSPTSRDVAWRVAFD